MVSWHMPGSKEIQLANFRIHAVPFTTRILSLVSTGEERGRKGMGERGAERRGGINEASIRCRAK